MAEGPEKEGTETTPRDDTERERREEAERRALRSTADEGSEFDDPREEEGWTQPESSAQKGAPRDEG